MSDIILLVMALAGGGLMGGFYFSGLWWTVQKMTSSRNPYRLMLLSFLVRSLAVMAGFYLLLLPGWPALATGVLGFVVVRAVVIRKVGLPPLTLKDMHDGI
ncbi:ATP synthase subunit I [Aliifodinibius sp. S!AR15-10]|uniref:ATP synthase subunit I n=1 Tax=Aliifodinibius sp. S!AR15-10 TaxID=2950437 RepID=UPI00285B2143|nr:ATP synthase subunit I [Aliifodinibius sp. S!AR15-10]MDR8393259.1 ATP synthase subunit I [Aliifodinibius sp. S!AR15-10]